MAQLAYHVSTGSPLWGFPVQKYPVLYMALEDDYQRLQRRLFQMFGTECTDNLHLATIANRLDAGLEGQIKKFIQEHPGVKLVIIDVLQRIRELGSENYSYDKDYATVAKLKEVADSAGICLLIVHHTRKLKAQDAFEMISGTNGLMGAADGVFLFQKKHRSSDSATLEITGRDQPDQCLYLKRDPERPLWQLERIAVEQQAEPPDPVLEAVAKLVTVDDPTWEGTATELAEALQTELKPNALGMHLNIKAGRLMSEYAKLEQHRKTPSAH